MLCLFLLGQVQRRADGASKRGVVEVVGVQLGGAAIWDKEEEEEKEKKGGLRVTDKPDTKKALALSGLTLRCEIDQCICEWHIVQNQQQQQKKKRSRKGGHERGKRGWRVGRSG